jgi:hypothetical protein
MSYLSEELINKIMLYVSHPCADMINNCKITRFDNVKIMKTRNNKYLTLSFKLQVYFVLEMILQTKMNNYMNQTLLKEIYIINFKYDV